MLCKNRITLIGFLGQDAEIRSTPNGTIYTRFSERELETKRQRRIQNTHGMASRDQLEQAR
jgi:single-stranded DNA-binding protein